MRQWERWSASSGMLFVLLSFLSMALGWSRGPETDTLPAAQFATELLANRQVVEAAAFLMGLAGIAFLFFVSRLCTTLRRFEQEAGSLTGVVFAAGILWALMLLLSGAIGASGVGLADYHQHPEGAKTAIGLASFPFQIGALLLPAVLVGVTALLTLRTQVFPRWYGLGSAVFLPLVLVSGMTIFNLPVPLLPFVLLLFFIWVVVTSVLLVRQTGHNR